MNKILLLSSILSLSLSNAFAVNGEKVSPESWQNSIVVLDKTTNDKILFLSLDDSLVTQIPIKENGEGMINMKDKQSPRLKLMTAIPGYEKFLATSMPNDISNLQKDEYNNVRQGVYNKLVTMLDYLPENIGIAFAYGYQNPERLQEKFEYLLFDNKQNYPNPEVNYNKTAEFTGSNFKNSGLATGGRVLITLFDVTTNQILDLGKIGFNMSNSSNELFNPNITDAQKTNRKIMADAATKAGFALYGKNWYSLSYGDQVWAYINGAKEAIYGPVTQKDRQFQQKTKEALIANLIGQPTQTAMAQKQSQAALAVEQSEVNEEDDD